MTFPVLWSVGKMNSFRNFMKQYYLGFCSCEVDKDVPDPGLRNVILSWAALSVHLIDFLSVRHETSQSIIKLYSMLIRTYLKFGVHYLSLCPRNDRVPRICVEKNGKKLCEFFKTCQSQKGYRSVVYITTGRVMATEMFEWVQDINKWGVWSTFTARFMLGSLAEICGRRATG